LLSFQTSTSSSPLRDWEMAYISTVSSFKRYLPDIVDILLEPKQIEKILAKLKKSANNLVL
jgi:hypothetical protein